MTEPNVEADVARLIDQIGDIAERISIIVIEEEFDLIGPALDPALDFDWWRGPFGEIWRENRAPARGTSPQWDRVQRAVEKSAQLAAVEELILVMGGRLDAA